MKQIAKSGQVLEKLRASYGVDADLAGLAVFEINMLNTQPLRRAKGIFAGARVTAATLGEMATVVNKESIPLQEMHDNSELPTGRVFFCEVIDDELVGLIAVDGANHPDIVTKLENGTIDQVSIGMLSKHLNCSQCGFDYMGVGNEYHVWTLTCDEGHVVGTDGTFIWVDGVKSFYETSLVGLGAAVGARIVGASDSRLSKNPEFQRLAASSASSGFVGLQLTATPKEGPSVDLTAAIGQISTLSGEKATALAQLAASAAVVTERDATIVTLNARVAELAAAGEAPATALAAAEKAMATAVEHMTGELKLVLTALGKPIDALPTDIAGLAAAVAEHRAAFAAVIPVGGKTNSVSTELTQAPRPSAGAFRASK